jgi:hypothetical protein
MRGSRCVGLDLLKERFEQIEPAVNIADRIEELTLWQCRTVHAWRY